MQVHKRDTASRSRERPAYTRNDLKRAGSGPFSSRENINGLRRGRRRGAETTNGNGLYRHDPTEGAGKRKRGLMKGPARPFMSDKKKGGFKYLSTARFFHRFSPLFLSEARCAISHNFSRKNPEEKPVSENLIFCQFSSGPHSFRQGKFRGTTTAWNTSGNNPS